MTQDINVLALVKGSERYVFLFDDNNRAETLRILGRYASNPDLVTSPDRPAGRGQKIRQSVEQEEVATAPRFSLPLPSDNFDIED